MIKDNTENAGNVSCPGVLFVILSALLDIALLIAASQSWRHCGLLPVAWLLASGIWLFLTAVVLFSVARFLAARSRGVKQAGRAIVIVMNIGILLLVLFVPLDRFWLDLKFQFNQNLYNHIVELVEQGILKLNDGGYVSLPVEYSHLSACGGQVAVDTSDEVNRVFFFTSRDTFRSNFTGYMYRSDSKAPQPDDFLEVH
ncbi:MAG: hypothetical protein JXA33_28640 [Anaerolineae bacterium]|nr:hypothetical protein [Anaerolineae bacterium]